MVVSNPNEGMWSAADAWTLTEDLRIGRPEGEGPDVFWGIADFGVAPNGDVFVVDRSQEVRQFRATGEFVRTLGRQGEGPGEFQSAIGIAFDPDGNAWVADDRLRRYSMFGSDGALQQTIGMLAQGVGAFGHWHGVFDSQGRLYETSVGMPIPTEVPFTSVRLDRADHVDTVPALSYGFPLINGFPPPPDLVGRLVFSFDTAGTVWLGRTDQYRIIHQRLDSGDTLRIVERPLAPIPLTDAEKDSIARQLAGAGVRADDLPAARPLIQQLYAGPDGTLLVQLVTPPAARESVFDVFDREGRFLGQIRTSVRLAEGFLDPAPKVHGDCIYGIVTDSLDVQYLLRYRITQPASGTPRSD
ncbi:MAG: NHL repeat-containing protein [Longimicrobiales bacterium]